VHEFRTTVQEAQELSANIAGRIFDQGQAPSSIAVLVRSGPRAAEVVSALLDRGVPVTDWRGIAYESTERRLLITCLCALRSKLHSRQASRLAELMGVELQDERDTHAFIELHAGNPVADELLILRNEAFDGATPQQIATRAQAAIAAYDADAGARAEALVTAVADFESFDPNFSLDQLMAELALRSGGRPPTQGGGVKVATLHGTKGLQWPTVFLMGMEEGKLPDFRAEEEGTIPDERRACFVGVCRAEDELLLTYSQYFRTFYQAPSRFLGEMHLP
jgi:superfamily I DNA/RNA helicase